MTSNIRSDTPPPVPITYPRVVQSTYTAPFKFSYQLDPYTTQECCAPTKEAAEAEMQKYLKQLDDWCAAKGIDDIMYWPHTPGVFQLDDINRLMMIDRRENGTNNPATVLLIGQHEREHLASIWAGHRPLIPERRVKGVIAQTHELYRPFEFFGLMCYPVNKVSHAEVLR